MKITAYSHHPPVFSAHSGMNPLAHALGAKTVLYRQTWQWLQDRWWSAGHRLKWWGDAYYGSGWNALVPGLDERLLAWRTPHNTDVAHFIWAEFASPRHPALFRRKARRLVGTFHASARKLPDVVRDGYRALDAFDGITLMSASQEPFFEQRGFPRERSKVILHGVNTQYFTPPAQRIDRTPALRGLMVGSTERDHAMMKQILERLPNGILEMTILTAPAQRAYYYGNATPNACFPSMLSDAALLQSYQQADLLVMPMIDCTANNAVLESMACGTPVMVNRIGGIPEYVDPGCNVILDEHTVDAWVDRLIYWQKNRDKLEAMRAGARDWAEKFDWGEKAREYVAFYGELGQS